MIHGVFLRQIVHVIVAIGLGKDGGSGDTHIFTITFHHRCVPNTGIGSEAVSIY